MADHFDDGSPLKPPARAKAREWAERLERVAALASPKSHVISQLQHVADHAVATFMAVSRLARMAGWRRAGVDGRGEPPHRGMAESLPTAAKFARVGDLTA
jgi:hypothetical protein